MATATTELIDALRIAADRLKSGAVYAWGNHGACNCGHILQVVGSLSREEILRAAHSGVGEWTELAEEYCGVTNAPVDLLIGKLQKIGLTPSDIHHLEYLNNRTVLERLPGGFRWLQKNSREDVILYFETFAAILEDEWLSSIHLPALFEKEMASV